MQVTQLYRERIPEDACVLDLMSSWVSHLPQEKKYKRVVGHGMNAAEVVIQQPLPQCNMLPGKEPTGCEAHLANSCRLWLQGEKPSISLWEVLMESLDIFCRIQAEVASRL